MIFPPRSVSSSPSLPTSSATAPAAEESVTTSAASSDLPARTSPTLPPTLSGTRPRLDVMTTERLSASPSSLTERTETRELFVSRTRRGSSVQLTEPPWPVPGDAVSSLLQKIEQNKTFDQISTNIQKIG